MSILAQQTNIIIMDKLNIYYRAAAGQYSMIYASTHYLLSYTLNTPLARDVKLLRTQISEPQTGQLSPKTPEFN